MASWHRPLWLPQSLVTGVALLIVVVVASLTFFRGLDWGLPSRESDRWLFGERPVWSAAEILEKLANANDDSLAPVPGGEGGGQGVATRPARAATEPASDYPLTLTLSPGYGGEGTRGADVDASPILDRSRPIVLNGTDAKRAAIVQRYRLMSRQPDEFIQFKALAEMSQRGGLARLDPRLYQYGGLWIYPVGGLVRTAMAVGWIESPPAGVSAREFYLDRPDVFGRFYVVARAYSATWGVVAAVALFFIARRASSSRVLGVVAAIGFVLLPVVQTAAHEAKPHLAGMSLCLLAVIPAMRFVDGGRSRWLLVTGALCGAAMAMVISMVLSLAIVPAMVWLRMKNPLPRTRGRGQGEGVVAGNLLEARDGRDATPSPRPSPPGTGEREWSFLPSLVAGVVAALAVYAVTNPFVLINAIVAPELLRSNLGNTTAMYGVRGAFATVPDSIRIASHAMTPVGARIALAAAIALAVWRLRRVQLVAPRDDEPRRSGATICTLLAAPAALVAMQFILLSAGKPAEYARFGLLAVAAGCVATAVALRVAIRSPLRFGGVLVVSLVTCMLIPPLVIDHRADVWKWPDGDETALQLDTMRQLGGANVSGPWRLGVAYEPAPWSSPPVNLFEQEIVLVRMTPTMLNEVDVVTWPLNLESQLFEASTDRESLDWRQLRWGVRAESRDGGEERWRGGW